MTSVKIGKITYTGVDEAFTKRVQERINLGIPLPHEDDEALESCLFFDMLTVEQQEKIKTTDDFLEKRKIFADFLKS